MSSSKLIYHVKQYRGAYFVVELKIHALQDKSYEDGIKYSLIFIDTRSSKRVLMDNHRPKGHHYHIDESEFDYEFTSIDKLLKDFKKFVVIHFGEVI